ncbi:hairy-related 5 [Vanacampus margaritifer]
MKALTSPQPHRHRMRRVSKPMMEKRRRERINRSLETLRVLMLENTHNEKLTNPKVEKAEILESVVQFLKSDKKKESVPCAIKSVLSSKGQRPGGPPQQLDYQGGMRSCLQRIRHFIASDEPVTNQGSQESASVSPPAHVHPLYPPHLNQDQLQDSISHPYPSQEAEYQYCDTRKRFSATACAQSPDPVWRPWPQ